MGGSEGNNATVGKGMTQYEADYHGTLFEPGRYRIVLAEHKTFVEMKIHPDMNRKTRHESVEDLLNTWRNITPIKIQSHDIER